jgi:hypothetical protein
MIPLHPYFERSESPLVTRTFWGRRNLAAIMELSLDTLQISIFVLHQCLLCMGPCRRRENERESAGLMSCSAVKSHHWRIGAKFHHQVLPERAEETALSPWVDTETPKGERGDPVPWIS